MKVETREIYRCGFCNKIYLRKHFCEKHEGKCRKNPGNYQPCLDGCAHADKKELVYVRETPYTSEEVKVSVMYCSKKEEAVCPFWVNAYDVLYDDDSNEILNYYMPKECEHFTKEYLNL